MIITLAYTVGFENLAVHQAADQPTAEAHVAALPDDRTAFVFDTDRPDWLGDQLYDRYSCAQLPQLFNAVRDPSVPPVNKFEDKPTGLRRLAAQLLLRARASIMLTPPQTAQPQKEPSKMSEEQTPKQRGPRPKLFNYDGKLRVLKPNPYREGTRRYTAFAIYRDDMSPREALAAGAKPYDLNRALRSGHLSVE